MQTTINDNGSVSQERGAEWTQELDRRITQLEGSLLLHIHKSFKSTKKHYQTNFHSSRNSFILRKRFKNAEYENWKKLKRDDSYEMS
jgi:hypothetical protein